MTQPEALRLADLLLSENAMDCLEHSDDAAAELRRLYEENESLRQALAQPEQEPVAWYGVDDYDKKYLGWDKHDLLDEGFAWITPLYTAPPKREWVGLTEDEVFDCFSDSSKEGIPIEEVIEAKLKEKNGG